MHDGFVASCILETLSDLVRSVEQTKMVGFSSLSLNVEAQLQEGSQIGPVSIAKFMLLFLSCVELHITFKSP